MTADNHHSVKPEQNADSVRVIVTADTEQFDECLRALRLLVSQIGFALDGYLVSRPPAHNDRSGAP